MIVLLDHQPKDHMDPHLPIMFVGAALSLIAAWRLYYLNTHTHTKDKS